MKGESIVKILLKIFRKIFGRCDPEQEARENYLQRILDRYKKKKK